MFNDVATLIYKKNAEDCFNETDTEKKIMIELLNISPEINGGYSRARIPLSHMPQAGDEIHYKIKGRNEQSFQRVILSVTTNRDFHEVELS